LPRRRQPAAHGLDVRCPSERQRRRRHSGR
jgi:hypothetical protein